MNAAIATADPPVVGLDFLEALAERDFLRLASALAPDVRMRALIPPGPLELHGAGAAVARLESWFGPVDELDVLDSTAEPFADLLRVSYRLRVSDHPMRPGSGPQLIEQQLFCRVEEGRIASIDLLCSGFRPAGVEGP